jgi:Ca2+-binding EF-hand superfamily protein
MGFVERMMENDKNEDGKITKEELPEFMQQMIGRFDTNEDGALDKSEIEAMGQQFQRGGFGRGRRADNRPERPKRPEEDK